MILSRPSRPSPAQDEVIPEVATVTPGNGGEQASASRWDSPLRLSVTRPAPGAVTVAMSGEIDLAAVPRLRELIQQRLTAAHLNVVVLDLSLVSFCDSSGLELLLEAQHRAERRDIKLYIITADSAVRRLLELTGLTGRFAICESTAEALAASHA